MGQRVSGAINNIQLSGMTLAFAISLKGIQRDGNLLPVESNDIDLRLLNQFIKSLVSFLANPCKQNDARFK